MSRKFIDLNCDMGESYYQKVCGNDELIMPYISSANIACGFHGGDPLTIEKTVQMAIKYKVAIGAHPSYHDLQNFGRKKQELRPDELRALLLYQLGALKMIVEKSGARLAHVKPHGALYNAAAADSELAEIIAKTIFEIDQQLILVGLAGSKLQDAAGRTGLRFAKEAFADRAYNDDGTLLARNLPGAVIVDVERMIARTIEIILNKQISAHSGKIIPLYADTICIHGDNPAAPEFVRKLRSSLQKEKIELKAIGEH